MARCYRVWVKQTPQRRAKEVNYKQQVRAAATKRMDIQWSSLTQEQKVRMKAAVKSQWEACLSTGAARRATKEEYARAKQILRARCVIGFKDITVDGQATGEDKAKARIAVAGYEQEALDKADVDLDSPTCSKQSSRVAAQIGVSKKCKRGTGDISHAFLHGDPLPEPVFAKIPKEVCYFTS